jgi:DNA-binding Lrp family transcriptional regulator
MTRPLDTTDLRLIAELRAAPRATIVQRAESIGVSRGTVNARLEDDGVITAYGPDVDASAAGLSVLAFCTLEIQQGSHGATVAALERIPQILEIHTVTGTGDLLCRIVARSNDHLHDVLQQVASLATVRRSQTQLALSTSLQRTIADLLARH